MGLRPIGYVDTLIGYVGGDAIGRLLKAGLQWLKSITSPATLNDETENAFDALLVQSTCLQLGGDEGVEFTFSDIASYDGTTTLSDAGGGYCACTAGTLWNVVLNNGNTYCCAEGGGTLLYPKIGSTPATLAVGASGEAGAWSGLQDDLHCNIMDGYSLYEKGGELDIHVAYNGGVPFVITPPSGYTKTADRPAIGIHNGARTSFKQDPDATYLGVDEIVNGDFTVDDEWSKGDGWSINTTAGQAECDGTQTGNSSLRQNEVTTAGLRTYQIMFDAVVSAGAINNVALGGGNDFPNINSTRSYSAQITATDANDKLYIQADSSFVGSITNVVVKEVIAAENLIGISTLYYEADETTEKTVSWADILAWVSYSDDYTWLKFTSDGTSCYLTDSVIIDISADEDTYDKLVTWKGGGSCGGGTSPF